jgi:hypothetical protein
VEEVPWCGATEQFEVPNHVHLVEVAEVVGDVSPGARGAGYLDVKRGLEASDAGEELGGKTHAANEIALELTEAESRARSELRNTNGAVAFEYVFSYDGHGVFAREVCGEGDEKAFDEAHAIGECLALAEAGSDLAEFGRNKRRVEVAVGEFGCRKIEEARIAGGFEENGEGDDA